MNKHLVTLITAAFTAAITPCVHADTTVSTDTTQDGGTFTVTPPTLLVTHASNDPTLTLTNNASASWDGATIIGNLTGESGNLEILGGSTMSNNGSFNFIGTYGNETVYSGNGYIGLNEGSTGSALISGTDSQWINSRSLYVGYRGAGELTIASGGSVFSEFFWTSIGSGVGSSGTVTVTGAGSQWIHNDSIFVGDAGTGTMIIEAGGSLSSHSAWIGSLEGSTGSVVVSGTDSQWTNSGGSLYVGYGGNGNLTVSDGGLVTALSISASLGDLHGNGTISTKGVVLDGINLVFDTNNGLQQTLGFGSGGQLQLDVDGTGALGVGYKGNGSLTISDGVTVTSARGELGVHSGSTGSAVVSGAGSEWLIPNDVLHVGVFGSGDLLVEAGGYVTSALGQIGHDLGSLGTVTVTGAGSEWMINQGALFVNMGELIIEDGGSVSSLQTSIANEEGSQASVNVTGSNAHLTSNSHINVGGQGWGELLIEDGGSVSTNSTSIAAGGLGGGNITVTGVGSQLTNSHSLSVGDGGVGTLLVQAGGSISSNYGYIGYLSEGSVTVTGNGSEWTSSQWLDVGINGTGSLLVQDGGTVSTGNSNIRGTVSVVGAGSTFTIDQSLSFLNGGSLAVDAGGVVSSYLGSIDDGSSVTVTGNGSQWINSQELYVGGSFSGDLLVQGGGFVSSTTGYIGTLNGSQGNVTVTGNGSQWTNDGNLILGGTDLNTPTTGNGTLTIADGGTVTVNGTTRVHSDSTINLQAGGTLQTQSLDTTNGNFNFIGGMLIASSNITGNMEVSEHATLTGTPTITGNLLNSGTISPGNSPGLLTVEGDLTLTETSVLFMEFDGFGAGEFDQVSVGGDFLVDGALTLHFDYTPEIGQSFAIFIGDYEWLGSFASVTSNLGGELTVDISDLSTGGTIQIEAIPEPSTALLVLGAIAAGMLPRRRRIAARGYAPSLKDSAK